MTVGRFHGEVKAQRRSSFGCAVPPSGSLWLFRGSSRIPGPRRLKACVRSIRCKAGALLSSWRAWRCPATVICQQHLWEAACFQWLWIFWPYLSVWLIEAHNRCCHAFKLIICIPHCAGCLWFGMAFRFLVKCEWSGSKLEEIIRWTKIPGLSKPAKSMFSVWISTLIHLI